MWETGHCFVQIYFLLLLASADTDRYWGHLHRVHHAALHLHCCHPLGRHLCYPSEILPKNWTAAQATGSWRWGRRGGRTTHLFRCICLIRQLQSECSGWKKPGERSEPDTIEAREETSLWGRCHRNHNSANRDGDGWGPGGQRSPQWTKTRRRKGWPRRDGATKGWNPFIEVRPAK